MEIEHSGLRDHAATGSGRNGNKAVAGAVSEAFARWLQHLYMPLSSCYRRKRIISP